MVWLDYLLIAVAVLSVVVGFFRGAVRELLGLLVWVAAYLLTIRFAATLDLHLVGSIESPTTRLVVSNVSIFLGVLILGTIVVSLASMLVRSVGLGGLDRLLGGVYGVLRGVFMLAVAVLVAGASPLRQETWWKQSILVPELQPLAEALHHLIPEQWRTYFAPRDSEVQVLEFRPEH